MDRALCSRRGFRRRIPHLRVQQSAAAPRRDAARFEVKPSNGREEDAGIQQELLLARKAFTSAIYRHAAQICSCPEPHDGKTPWESLTSQKTTAGLWSDEELC